MRRYTMPQNFIFLTLKEYRNMYTKRISYPFANCDVLGLDIRNLNSCKQKCINITVDNLSEISVAVNSCNGRCPIVEGNTINDLCMLCPHNEEYIVSFKNSAFQCNELNLALRFCVAMLIACRFILCSDKIDEFNKACDFISGQEINKEFIDAYNRSGKKWNNDTLSFSLGKVFYSAISVIRTCYGDDAAVYTEAFINTVIPPLAYGNHANNYAA